MSWTRVPTLGLGLILTISVAAAGQPDSSVTGTLHISVAPAGEAVVSITQSSDGSYTVYLERVQHIFLDPVTIQILGQTGEERITSISCVAPQPYSYTGTFLTIRSQSGGRIRSVGSIVRTGGTWFIDQLLLSGDLGEGTDELHRALTVDSVADARIAGNVLGDISATIGIGKSRATSPATSSSPTTRRLFS
jgi:hypothetical protein